MNLVAFSIKTKGMRNFTRQLWTVFTRFGFTEIPTRRALYSVLEATREERISHCTALVEHIEQQDMPLLHFGCWPNGKRAALAVTGDIDSVTIQDFFLRILEVKKNR